LTKVDPSLIERIDITSNDFEEDDVEYIEKFLKEKNIAHLTRYL
jgi:hypothetical protein